MARLHCLQRTVVLISCKAKRPTRGGIHDREATARAYMMLVSGCLTRSIAISDRRAKRGVKALMKLKNQRFLSRHGKSETKPCLPPLVTSMAGKEL